MSSRARKYWSCSTWFSLKPRKFQACGALYLILVLSFFALSPFSSDFCEVVCEGDLVTALPRVHCGPLTFCEACSPRLCCGNLFCGLREYKHLGIPAFLGRKNAARGDLLINPSGVERVAYLHWARSMASHQVCLRNESWLVYLAWQMKSIKLYAL